MRLIDADQLLAAIRERYRTSGVTDFVEPDEMIELVRRQPTVTGKEGR